MNNDRGYGKIIVNNNGIGDDDVCSNNESMIK
jgi:hypothetical protein